MSAVSNALHAEGDFKIAVWEGSGWESWIWHWCNKASISKEMAWMSCGLTGTKECGACGTPVPEGLVGLWTMHNWDCIQTWEGPGEEYIATI
jgi:hypothetical protein